MSKKLNMATGGGRPNNTKTKVDHKLHKLAVTVFVIMIVVALCIKIVLF